MTSLLEVPHRRRSVYNIVGSTVMAMPERPKIEARRTDKVLGFLGRGCSLPHQLGDLWSAAVSSPSGVRGEALAPATWRFRTFYRLAKSLLMLILLILNFYQ